MSDSTIVLPGHEIIVPNRLYISKPNDRVIDLCLLSRYTVPTEEDVVSHLSETVLGVAAPAHSISQQNLENWVKKLPQELRSQLIAQEGSYVDAIKNVYPYCGGDEKLDVEFGIIPSQYFNKNITLTNLETLLQELSNKTKTWGWLFDLVFDINTGTLPETAAIEMLLSGEEVSELVTESVAFKKYKIRVNVRHRQKLVSRLYDALTNENLKLVHNGNQAKCERASTEAFYEMIKRSAECKTENKLEKVEVPIKPRVVELPKNPFMRYLPDPFGNN